MINTYYSNNVVVLSDVRGVCDLQEYADALQNSGVHGAVLVLDPTFNTDAMATALGIHSNKHMIRRHLVEEMQSLVGPVR